MSDRHPIMLHVLLLACLAAGWGCSAHRNPSIAMATAPAVRLAPTDEARYAFVAAQLAEQAGDFQKAVQYYYRALEQDPESLTVRRHLISGLIRLERFHEARREYDFIIASDNADSQSRYMLGQLYEAAGDTRVAEALYRDAISISQENSGPYTKLGILLLQQDRPETALEYLEKALVVNPRDREARRVLVQYDSLHAPGKVETLLQAALQEAPDDIEWLGILAEHYTDRNQKEKAAQVYQQMLDAHPNAVEAHRFLSIYYMKKNDWDGAINQLEKLLKFDPEDRLARRNLGLALFKRGDYREARRHLEMLIHAEAGDALTHYLMGAIYRKSGLAHLAVEQFSNAIKLDGDMIEAHLGLGGSLLSIGEYAKAEKIMHEACVRFSKIPEVWMNYGLALLRQEKYSEALQAFLSAQRLAPDNALVFFHLGRVHHARGDFEQAVDAWKRALALDPNFADAYNHLGYTYAEKGRDLAQAVVWLKKALALEPENGYFLDSLGWAYYKMGRYQLALENLIASRDAFGKMGQRVDAVIYEHLGDVYYQLKQYPAARKAWQEALEQEPGNHEIREKLQKIGPMGDDALDQETRNHIGAGQG